MKKIFKNFTGYPAKTCSFIFLLFFCILVFSACSEENSTTVPNVVNDGTPDTLIPDETGDLLIGLTDADGDFLAYTVEVKSLTLTKANGAVVNTLPLSSTIDFTQYVNMTEFLAISTIPSGVYVKGKMVLDFSNADVQVEVSGASKTATLKDTDGNDLTGAVELDINLGNANKLLIAPGVPAHLELDFDLASTNEVDVSADPPVVTVEPSLVVSVNPTQLKENRVRGLFESADVNGSTFKLKIRPMRVKFDIDNTKKFGVLKVSCLDSTVYEIDGVSYIGSEGLAQLALKDNTTSVIAVGKIEVSSGTISASEVYAGTSVPGGDMDVVRGSIISMSGYVATIKGASIHRNKGSIIFNDFVTVDFTNVAKVTKQLEKGILTRDDIFPGSFITAFGTITTSGNGYSMDSTNIARIHISRLKGVVISKSTDSIIIDLKKIDRRKSSVFTDITTALNFTVNTGVLDISSLEANDLVEIRGFFGASESFTAKTIIKKTDRGSVARINWKALGSSTPFTAANSTGLTIDVNSTMIGAVHHVNRHGLPINLQDTNVPFLIKPNSTNLGVFGIAKKGRIEIYTTFSNFVEGVNNSLDPVKLKRIVVIGEYNSTDNSIIAFSIKVFLRD